MHRRSLRVLALVLTALMSQAAVADAYTQDPYSSAYNNMQSNNCWCVPAAARTWVMYITGGTAPSQSTMETYAQSGNKYSWGACPSGGPGGNDPRGWAWAMYDATPAGYGFNDYMSTSQITMDWEFVYGIRAEAHPDGALVAYGKHAVDVVGYYTLNDPNSSLQQTLYGFYLLDPWYGRGASGLPNWYNGFSPNSYVTIANWNSLYFRLDTNDGAYWNNKYVAVLRNSTGVAPSDNPPVSYGDLHVGGLAPASMGASTLAGAIVSPTIQDAVTLGLRQNDLEHGGALGVDLTGYSIGPSVHVDSLASELPSYDLAQIMVGGRLAAVAMVSEIGPDYAFAGITPWSGSFPLGSSSAMASALASNGMGGTARLVWAWADEGGSPFTPFVEATDIITGAPAYLSVTGRHDSIHLVPGETPAH